MSGALRHAALALLLVACTDASKSNEAPRAKKGALSREPLSALPAAPSLDPAIVDLGRRLFSDKRLSTDDSIACASCHDLDAGGDDGKKLSQGVDGHVGEVNALTVYNASLNFALFWDGRAKSLEEQIDGPVHNPNEMGSRWDEVVTKLQADAEVRGTFAKLFPDGVTADNVKKAIATFERTLLTRGSAFDRWIEGEAGALDADQREGYETFKTVGCVACHQGANVGGNMFQRFGVLGDYFKDRGSVGAADYGRFNVTHREADRFVFRVPSLRDVEKTAPYFHDGSATTLPEAVQVMAKYQLGRPLADRQVAVLVAFLQSLSEPPRATP